MTYRKEINQLLTSLDVAFVNEELDFFIPSHNLAIMFNKLYPTSVVISDRLHNRHKYEVCQESGIRLLMISEDEWEDRGAVIKSRISNILGKSKKGPGARKLRIAKLHNGEANRFFERHHVQGKTGSIIYAVGAWDSENLVGAMAFNQQRNTQDIELVRFATNGLTYAGMFSRLLKTSLNDNQYSEILSFADLRYSEGNVYEKNGFTLVGKIPPDYRYVYGGRTWHKSSFTKKKINEKFGLDMSQMTERQAMESLNIPRIYDCGKLKYCLNV